MTQPVLFMAGKYFEFITITALLFQISGGIE